MSAPTCRHWLGDAGRHCGATDGVRPYLTGPRWWVRTDGSVVPPAPLGASRLVDDRAVASGKRRSSPDRYQEARDAEQERRERERQARRGHLAPVPDDPGNGAARGIASPGHLTLDRPHSRSASHPSSGGRYP